MAQTDQGAPSANDGVIEMTARIVASYVGNNAVAEGDLPQVISVVHAAIGELSGGPVTPEQKPAVPIRQSVKPDYIVCLEDGRKLTMLKRHLATAYGMTPEEYRAKWKLPPDYPMVAPNYAKRRSELAKKFGLGKQPR